jgi:response regulator RpfG family c-di-GMP phosphodiesterase
MSNASTIATVRLSRWCWRSFGNCGCWKKRPTEAIGPSEERAPRALLIEDNVNERELLAGYLRSYGIETTTANDGQDALDYLSLHALPDVVLLDMQMPRCNGRCFIKKVRASAISAT